VLRRGIQAAAVGNGADVPKKRVFITEDFPCSEAGIIRGYRWWSTVSITGVALGIGNGDDTLFGIAAGDAADGDRPLLEVDIPSRPGRMRATACRSVR
jgi:hypothetical protein